MGADSAHGAGWSSIRSRSAWHGIWDSIFRLKTGPCGLRFIRLTLLTQSELECTGPHFGGISSGILDLKHFTPLAFHFQKT